MPIRQAVAADLPMVQAIVRDAYSPYIARIGKPPGPMQDNYARRIADGQVSVLEDSGAVVGVVVLEQGPDGWWLDNIAVSPAQHGKGYGRDLLMFAEAEVRRHGADAIWLYTNALMTENIALYTRIGYVQTDRRTAAGFDRVIMRKDLR